MQADAYLLAEPAGIKHSRSVEGKLEHFSIQKWSDARHWRLAPSICLLFAAGRLLCRLMLCEMGKLRREAMQENAIKLDYR